ncbi:MAG: helix-turn-helix domain-containing protein [Clostridia bacterium]|nr:helix-turn-helix domain-containing protein [Clostridia bacterium]
MEYIDRIKKIKSKKKITNEQLSEMTGIPLGTLSKIMAEISDSPKFSNILAICDALGCSVNYVVTGEPDNDNNYKLEAGEIRFIENYRQLDNHGRELVALVLNKESERMTKASYGIGTETVAPAKSARILTPKKTNATYIPSASAAVGGRRSISLYDMGVSAGRGMYLDSDSTENITIPDTVKTQTADYALRISGTSMEPKYHSGDILLIEHCDSVEFGELGIFILDGESYFKQFGGDRLISLNPEYGDILLKDFASAECYGRVVGKLKKK